MSEEPSPDYRSPAAKTLALLEKRVEAEPQRPTSMPSEDDIAEAWREILYDVLEHRVGTRLSEGVSDAALDEFERLVENGDDDAAQAWLEMHAPQYPQVIQEETAILIAEAVDWFAGHLGMVNVDGVR